jgi:plastocyanin
MEPKNNQRNLVILIIILAAVGYYLFQSQKVVAPAQDEITQSEVSTSTSDTINNTVPAKTAVKTTKTTTTSSLPTMTKEGYYLVSYTDKGFVPASLQIAAGKSVRFVNNASRAMRIFADDKTSTLYSEMNQSKTVGRGGIYDFTFGTAGTWAYHNENNLADKGVVIVK